MKMITCLMKHRVTAAVALAPTSGDHHWIWLTMTVLILLVLLVVLNRTSPPSCQKDRYVSWEPSPTSGSIFQNHNKVSKKIM
ncbi:unnamed protein product [Callosobruchus maculatus]|uniref:Uncharacterized protein n=1 Tax=Callosobruchus maculatus TaxID=64391 RepID=A0A653CCI4_CALMS|nr:unnamed protein product [Callosobruchus maculatus]